MAASLPDRTYTVFAISDGTKYNLTSAVVALDRDDNNKEIAQRVVITLTNVQVGNIWLSSILKARDRIFIYALNNGKEEEVFRGFFWKRNYLSSLTDREIQYTCYDNLIYLQESEDSLYFSSGKSTKDITRTICEKWGIKLTYSYESITHTKLPLRGNLADILRADILDEVKRKTDKKYVVLSDKDTMYIKRVGSNTTVYHFVSGKNVISAASGWTLDGVITQVVILGKADKDDREPVEATVSGKTAEYGTLQKVITLGSNTSLADAKLEATNIINENGEPTWEYKIVAADIPWIRKGDRIYVSAGDVIGYKIVTDISRTASNQKCTVTMVLESEYAGGDSSGYSYGDGKIGHTLDGGGEISYSAGSHMLSHHCAETKDDVSYWLHVPENATPNMPIIVFLHGAGERNNINAIRDYGPIVQAKKIYGSDYPFIAVYPSLKYESWYSYDFPTTIKSLIDDVVAECEADAGRIIITGHSLGSMGTWDLVSRYGSYFSCAVPVSCYISGGVTNYDNLAKIPIWAFCGDGYDDIGYSAAMQENVETINDHGGNADFTLIPGSTHSASKELAYTEETFTWMIAQ